MHRHESGSAVSVDKATPLATRALFWISTRTAGDPLLCSLPSLPRAELPFDYTGNKTPVPSQLPVTRLLVWNRSDSTLQFLIRFFPCVLFIPTQPEKICNVTHRTIRFCYFTGYRTRHGHPLHLEVVSIGLPYGMQQEVLLS